MPRRECCGAWTDQPHRSTCREPLRPARAEDVERARRSEAPPPPVRAAIDVVAERVEHLLAPLRSMPRSIPNNPDFKREPPPVSIDVELANAQRCPGCGGIYCDRGDVRGWRPMPTSDLEPAQIAEALRRATPTIKVTVNHVDEPQGDKVMTSHAPYAAGAIYDEAHRAIYGEPIESGAIDRGPLQRRLEELFRKWEAEPAPTLRGDTCGCGANAVPGTGFCFTCSPAYPRQLRPPGRTEAHSVISKNAGASIGDNEGVWMAEPRRMGNVEFVAGVDFQRRGDALSILDFGRAPTVGIDLPLAGQIREALLRGAKVTIGSESVTSKTIHACGGTAARFDVERIAGHWTIIDTETKAGMVITFCPFCGDKLATEGA